MKNLYNLLARIVMFILLMVISLWYYEIIEIDLKDIAMSMFISICLLIIITTNRIKDKLEQR